LWGLITHVGKAILETEHDYSLNISELLEKKNSDP